MIDRLSAACRPHSRPVGYQSWRDLTFVHWRVPVAEIEPLVPRPLAIDTFDGSAWIGLVLFRMFRVRPWWFPSVYGLSAFFETNVRTYVHLGGRDPGVYFFSLDASQPLAVRAARHLWSLNYVRAQMNIERHHARLTYVSRRPQGAYSRVSIELAGGAGRQSAPTFHASPGSLEHFLIERYYLYVVRRGKLMRAQVHHAPYPLETAQLIEADESLLAANGLCPPAGPCHAVFSPGVDVEVFGLSPAGSART
jgi:hypothetical protein